MKIILIGNNEYITENTINSLNLNETDIVVLFNHMYPLKFEKIKNHKNLVCVLRFRPTKKDMTGCKEYYKNKSLFKKVLVYYFSDLNKNDKKLYDKYKKYIEKDKFVDYTSVYKKAINKFKIDYPSGGCTTGFSAVLYFLYKNINSIFDIKQESENMSIDIKNLSNLVLNNELNNEVADTDKKLDLYNYYEKKKIVLVGFTGIYNGKLLKTWHRCDFEQEFYNKLLDKKIIQKYDIKDKKNKPKKKIIKTGINYVSCIKKILVKTIKPKKK